MKGPDSECDPRLEQGKMREAGKMESPVTQKHGRSILDREQHTGIPNKEPGESQGAEMGVAEPCSGEEETGHFLNAYQVTDAKPGILLIYSV